MELKSLGVEIGSNGPAAHWRSLRRPDFTKPGTYKLSLEGAIRLSGDTDIPFTSGEVRWEVVERGIEPIENVVETAETKLREVVKLPSHQRIYSPKELEGGYIVVDDKAGNRLVRFSDSGEKWSYNRYTVTCSPQGEVLSIHSQSAAKCIAAGTLVSTPKGDVPVESLEPGMSIWGFDLEEKIRVAVKARFVRRHYAEFTVRFGELRVVPEHPIYADRRWRLAGELRGGESVVGPDGKEQRLPTPELLHGTTEVYEIAVDGPNNYFAGGVLVHNKQLVPNPHHDDPWYTLWPRRDSDRKQLWPVPAEGKGFEKQ